MILFAVFVTLLVLALLIAWRAEGIAQRAAEWEQRDAAYTAFMLASIAALFLSGGVIASGIAWYLA